MIELLLKIAAVALVGAAAYFYWAGNWDWTFAFGVLAACSFFLSLKYRIKRKIALTESKTAEIDDARFVGIADSEARKSSDRDAIEDILRK